MSQSSPQKNVPCAESTTTAPAASTIRPNRPTASRRSSPVVRSTALSNSGPVVQIDCSPRQTDSRAGGAVAAGGAPAGGGAAVPGAGAAYAAPAGAAAGDAAGAAARRGRPPGGNRNRLSTNSPMSVSRLASAATTGLGRGGGPPGRAAPSPAAPRRGGGPHPAPPGTTRPAPAP